MIAIIFLCIVKATSDVIPVIPVIPAFPGTAQIALATVPVRLKMSHSV